MNSEFVFDDKNNLVKLLIKKISSPSKIKIHNTLYLLFAYYGATYGKVGESVNGEHKYPSYLFDANFKIWRYGVLDYDIKNKEYGSDDIANGFEHHFDLDDKQKNILLFIDNITSQINEIDDFNLVDLIHQDNVWFDAYSIHGENSDMNSKEIISEYYDRLDSNK